MSGRLIDLTQPNVAFPDPVVVDTNVVIAYFQAFFPGEHPQHVARATAFFQRLQQGNQQALLTPTAYSELLHVAVKKRYQNLQKQYGLQRWNELYKRDPSILQLFKPTLTLIRQGLITNNVVIAGPEDLDFAAFPPAVPFEDALIDRMTAYGLDTSDTVILMEALQLGQAAVVSMDHDMQRALPDFDIYTWI